MKYASAEPVPEGSGRRLLLLEGELLQVEVQLLALQDVSVTSSALSRPGRDGSVKGTGPDLLGQSGVQSGVLLPLGQDSLNVVGLLGLALAGSSLGGLGSTERSGVVSLVPLSEGSSIDLDDGTLNQGLGSEQLVVGRVVNDVDNPGLPGDVLGTPSEVTRVQSHGSVLGVSSPDTDLVNPLGTQLGHGGLTTELELSLLPVLGPSGTRCRALVARITSNTL